MKKIIFLFLNIIILISSLSGEIIKTSSIEDIRDETTPDTLVLFNIAEVLMDSETSLGTQAWRKFVRLRLNSQEHDELTLFVFQNVPPKSPEASLPELIRELQTEGLQVFALTSRGRHEWYNSEIPNIDLITEKLLKRIGIDFSNTKINERLLALSSQFEDFYHEGVIYASV